MKKLLTLTAVGAILTAPASAVQKCVALDATKTCTGTKPADYASSLTATCYGTNNEEIPVQFIAVCADTSGSTRDQKDTIAYTAASDASYSNDYCWCKMVSPAVSKWVLADDDLERDSCLRTCASFCYYSLIYSSYQAFRTAFFTNLSD